MKKELSYQEELKEICNKMQKSFAIKINLISTIRTYQCLKKLTKLNKKTNNEHIDDLMHIVGRTKLSYQNYCEQNNYIPAPEVNKKIKETYIELSRKAMKIKTKKKNVTNANSTMNIEYNSDKGKYLVNYLDNGEIVKSKEYKIHNIKNLGQKREFVLDRLTKINYGINIFKELDIDDKNFYKVNPDIIHIFLEEGQIDYAKMYIKQVVGGETMHTPFGIKYVLNRDVKKGVFSPEENKNMKKMARADRLANELVICSDKREKKIKKTQHIANTEKKDIIESIKRNIKIRSIKEKLEVEKIATKERNDKIEKIMEKKQQFFRQKIVVKKDTRRGVVGQTSEYGCKIYNLDKTYKDTNNLDDFISAILNVNNNSEIYDANRKNIVRNINRNNKKVVAHSER